MSAFVITHNSVPVQIIEGTIFDVQHELCKRYCPTFSMRRAIEMGYGFHRYYG